MLNNPLNVETFAHGWKLLNKRFKNDCDNEIMMIYFEDLESKLTGEEFFIAVKRCILEEQFFPSAKIIIEKVQASIEALAIKEWESILDLLPEYAIAHSTKSRFKSNFSLNTDAVIKSIGGWDTLLHTKIEDLPFLRKAFLKKFDITSEMEARQSAIRKSLGGQK